MRLQIVHGDIETPEEQESLQEISQTMGGFMILCGAFTVEGTNDTTTFEVAATIPEYVVVMARACEQLYPHWRVTVS